MGPVLFEQDLIEAKTTVQDRLTFLQGELEKCDKQIHDRESQQQDIGNRVSEKQREMQERAQKAAMQVLQEQDDA